MKISFANVCEWFVDGKIGIHTGEDETECSIFGAKRKFKNIGKLNLTYKEKRYYATLHLGVSIFHYETYRVKIDVRMNSSI